MVECDACEADDKLEENSDCRDKSYCTIEIEMKVVAKAHTEDEGNLEPSKRDSRGELLDVAEQE